MFQASNATTDSDAKQGILNSATATLASTCGACLTFVGSYLFSQQNQQQPPTAEEIRKTEHRQIIDKHLADSWQKFQPDLERASLLKRMTPRQQENFLTEEREYITKKTAEDFLKHKQAPTKNQHMEEFLQNYKNRQSASKSQPKETKKHVRFSSTNTYY